MAKRWKRMIGPAISSVSDRLPGLIDASSTRAAPIVNICVDDALILAV
jgi:hypothetical protein